MTKIRQCLTHVLICALLLSTTVRAESVSDKSSAISPKHVPGAGEFVHGQGYGKLLMRVLVFGAIPVQGIHYVPEGTDLIFAIMYAGGYGDFSSLNGITIRRRGVEEQIEVPLEDLIEEGKAIPKLTDGDIITVPFNWKKDLQTVLTVTGFVTSITGLTLSLLALTRRD